MINNIPFFIAWRYLLGTKTEKNISLMVLICFLGILVGSCSLALVVSVMRGFEKVTHEKMQGIHAQVIMRSYGQRLNFDQISKILNSEFPEIESFSPSNFKQTILQSETVDDPTTVVLMKGIDPATEALVSSIEKKIISGITPEKKLSSLIKNNQIIIGNKLAETLEVQPGNAVTVLFSDEEKTKRRKITFDSKDAVVAGIFKTGIDEFDTNMIYCALPFLQELFPESGATQINMKLKPNANEQDVIQKLKFRFGLEIYSWKDLYPALVSALKLEKYAMFFILMLITLVASMNIISLLFMQITNKRSDIAILKALGTSNSAITRIFVYIGMSISLAGSIAGLILAGIIGWLLKTYPFITLPDAYYVTHLPITLEWHIFALVFCVILVISFFASWIPARKARSIIIANVLRFEA